MRLHSAIAGFASLAMVSLFAASAATSVLAASLLEPRKSNEAGIQVVVTPKPFDPTAMTWDFDVVMDTHTKPLGDDLARVSELVVDGRSYASAGWQGDPPGGHHRKGVLKFARPADPPNSVEVRINGIGGPGVRTFKWD